MLKEFLEQQLLPLYAADSNSFPPHIQEEFLTKEGYLSKDHICTITSTRMSTSSFRKIVKQVFGEAEFSSEKVLNELSKAEFMAMYEFGKFASVKSWIGYSYEKTGKVITRENALNWIAGY